MTKTANRVAISALALSTMIALSSCGSKQATYVHTEKPEWQEYMQRSALKAARRCGPARRDWALPRNGRCSG